MHHAEAKESNQDGVGDTDTQPSGGAGAEKERINVTENSSRSLRNCHPTLVRMNDLHYNSHLRGIGKMMIVFLNRRTC